MKHATQVSYDSRAATNGNASISACFVHSPNADCFASRLIGQNKNRWFPTGFYYFNKAARRACRRLFYASAIAPTGHCPAQDPQSIHLSASITNCPSPIEIAPTGHCPSQDPQLMQESPIQYAIINDLLI